MCTARLFSQGVNLFALKILLGQGRPPSTIFGNRKLETLGEDHIPLCSLILTQYRSVTDRRTDLP